ncbi:MAG: hypothetical protein MK082_09695 [Phycisphaerales bacterium]|nr:hypothetical protein [Phycisphaerales bacterium]
MPDYQVLSEDEGADCWIYEVTLGDPAGESTRHQVRLSWADYDLWVRDGSIEPVRVAKAILEFITGHEAFTPLPGRVDSSHPRRLDSTADDVINRLIREMGA